MKTFKHSAVLAVLAAAGTSCMIGLPTAHGALLAYEPFNYTPGSTGTSSANTLNGSLPPVPVQSPGFGFTSSGWTVYGANTAVHSSGSYPFAIQSGSLTASSNSGALATAGNSLTYNSSIYNGYTDLAYAQFASPITSAGTTIWYSFLLTPTSGFNDLMLGSNNANTPTTGFAVGTTGASSGNSFYINAGAGDNTTIAQGGSAVNGNTYFMVVEDIGATTPGGTDTLNLFVDPTPGATAPTTSSPSFVLTNNQLKTGSLNFLMLGVGNAASWDEFRAGTSYADVAPAAPEPATLGLFAVGALGFIASGLTKRRIKSGRPV